MATLSMPEGRSSTLSVRHAQAVVFAAACVMAGVYWDISWHMSIGRDSFWTPAHLLIQAGGLIAGLSSGYVALRTTFAGNEADRSAAVTVWGFRAPLGAWVCAWGCVAMVTSAPFDNWWHDAYGLDVKIVSPPHTILAIGIYSIMWGAMLLTLAKQNTSEGKARHRFGQLALVVGGLLLMNGAIFLTEYSDRFMQHGGQFYRISAIIYPFTLVAIARGSRHRWAATCSAAVYMGIMLALMWIIQIFPATPKLGPIYQPITHMVALAFPLWLIVPGFLIDVVRHRLDGRVPAAVLAVALGAAFLVGLVAVQWPFSSFLVESPVARGWLFNASNFVYWAGPAYVERTRHFFGTPAQPIDFAVALGFGSVSAWIGLGWGRWLSKVQR